MPSITFSFNQPSAAPVPQAFTPVNVTRLRNYELCLCFVQRIIGSYFPAARSKELQPLFHTLGQVACCIDTHLDDLNQLQKKQLLELFPAYFDALSDKEDIFYKQLHELCSKLNTSIYPPSSAKMLYQFFCYCKEKGLQDELKQFSLAVIRSGVQKAGAASGKEVMQCLAMEGEASIRFLLLLLQSEKALPVNDIEIKNLKSYLRKLERMLNIADDIADSRRDRQRGIIKLNTGWNYHFSLISRLLQTFFSTLSHHHVFFVRHFVLFTRSWIASR
jgi:hypothetical protein